MTISCFKRVKLLLIQIEESFSTCNILFFFFLINLFLFWPGQQSLDSLVQLKEAVNGVYSDHHPPVMALLWRYILYFISGCGGIFLFHLSLFYSACYIFMQALSATRLKYFYLIYPLFPPIFFYSFMIWKDVGFAFSFLFVSAAISYFVIKSKKPRWYQLFFVILILFYGSAVKFQAIYCAIFMLLGICYIFNNFKLNLKTILYTIFSYLILLFSVNQFNDFFVPKAKKSDSWKFVKIYDLAGMSLILDKPIFPEYILQSKNFSFDLVKQKFNYERVDDIVFYEDSPIPRVETDQNRQELLSLWQSAVLKNPVVYLKHRFKNWQRILFAKPLEKLDTLDFNQFNSFGWLAKLQNKNSNNYLEYYLSKFIFLVLNFIRYLFCFAFVFVFMLTYFALGVLNRNNKYGLLLIVMNGAALALVFSLFVMCMASSLRYVYMAVCLVHASHVVAYMCLKNRNFRFNF